MRAPSTIRNKADWPPDYVAILAWRQNQVLKMRNNAALIKGAKEYYRTRPVEFINHWCDTYDPRNAGTEFPTKMPLCMFEKQEELVLCLTSLVKDQESGLIEKCRDMGATWVCCAFSVWLWLFWPGASVGWGSRKEQLVDKIGDPDSIFEKIRMLVNGLPRFFWPAGFKPDDHMTYMRIVNPETGATVTGEAGDNIGRGGRKLIYFKDESAHYERPEKIEAALADTTRVQVDISSVNGLGNVFHRRREAGQDWYPGAELDKGTTRVFVMDWSDHPAKTQEWYDNRKKKAISDGLLHVFAQEVERNYAAAVEGIIIPAEWVKAAIDAHIALGIEDSGNWGSALDVADEGSDRNAQVKRQGIVLRFAEEWGARDVAQTARRAIDNCRGLGKVELQYDCIGVGAGVKSEVNNLKDAAEDMKELRKTLDLITLVPWNAAAGVLNPKGYVVEDDPESPRNEDFYANLKAQGWWELRTRFYKTYRAVVEGVEYNHDELISLDSSLPLLRQIQKELSQPTSSKGARMKLVVDKKPPGTKSPNIADAIVMAYWPIQPKKSYGILLPM